MHITEEQAKREGIELTFNRLFAVSSFAGNALTTVGQATPYQAMGGITGFSSLAEGYLRLDPSGRGL